MNQNRRMTTGVILAAMLTACSPSPPPSEPEVAQPAETVATPQPAEPLEPLPAAHTPRAQTGNMVVYTCDDKSGLTLTYEANSVLVKLPTGSTMLSRAELVPSGGGEAYIGEELSVHRNGSVVQLQGGGKLRTCTESPISG